MITKRTKMIMMAAISALIIMTVPSTAVYAQFQQPQPQPQPQPQQQQQQQGEVFESEEDGFTLQIPEGWVIEDFDNMPAEENREDIALLCPENDALPGIGGESNCLAANYTDAIYISRWPDLQSIPEFQDIPEPPTTNDLVALAIQALQNTNQTSAIEIVNTTDVDEFRKIVNMTYTYYDDVGTPFNPFDDYSYNIKGINMFVLSPDDRNMGYHIFNRLATPNVLNMTEHSPAVQEVFDSFELVS